MSRYLVLTSIFYPENAANAVRMSNLVDELLKQGHSVDVVSAFPYYQGAERDSRYNGRLFTKESYRQARVLRCYVPAGEKRNLLFRLLTFFSFMVLSVVGVLLYFRGRYDAVLAISPPFFTGVSAYTLGLIKRCPWFFDIQDLYPETAYQLGMVKKGLSYWFLKKLELFFYQTSAGLFVISPGFKRYIYKLGIPENKIHIFRSWVNRSALSDDSKFENPGKLTLIFCGNMGLAQNLMSLKEGFLSFKNDARYEFLFVGDGVERQSIESYFLENGMTNVCFTGSVPHKKVPYYLKGADVALVHLDKNPLYKITIPSKTYEYMGYGLPLLLGVEGDALDLIEKHGVGLGFEPGNSKDFVKKLRKLFEDEEARKQMSYNSSRVSVSFDRYLCCERYVKRVEQKLKVNNQH